MHEFSNPAPFSLLCGWLVGCLFVGLHDNCDDDHDDFDSDSDYDDNATATFLSATG